MAVTLNEVRLIGNVGKDPDIRMTQDGKEVASFTLATSDVWHDKVTGERKEKTEWHKIVVFVNRLVSLVKSHVRKGSRLYISGSIQTRKWQDQSNVEKFITEILLQSHDSKLMLLSPGNRDDIQDDILRITGKNHQATSTIVEDEDDDIPF